MRVRGPLHKVTQKRAHLFLLGLAMLASIALAASGAVLKQQRQLSAATARCDKRANRLRQLCG